MNNKKVMSAIAVLLAVLMLIGLVVSVLPASVFADEDYTINPAWGLPELQARKEELAAKAEKSQEKIAELQEQHATLIEQKTAYDERDAYIREQITITDEQIGRYRSLIAEKEKEVTEAKRLEDEQLARYRARVRAMEENGGYNILTLLLRADSFSGFLTAIDDIRDIMSSDRLLEDRYIAAREEHERIQGEYEEEKEGYEQTLDELSTEQEQLRENIRQTEELMAKLEQEIEQNQTEYEAALAAETAAGEAIDAKIAQLYAAYMAAHPYVAPESASPANSSEGTESVQTDPEEGEYYYYEPDATGSGSLAWPVPGCYSVSSDYGERTHPITGEVSRMHYGMDIDGYAHDGGDIVACDNGVVTTVGYNSGYGNYIIVDHGNGMQTLYAHMSGTAVAEGTTVGQGETIGYLGATGMATGTHCHLEVFVDGENVNPADYVG